MIQVNLKRKWGNRSTVRGILDIPDYGFKCYTLELKESKSQFKNNCCVGSGVYELTSGFAEGSVFFRSYAARCGSGREVLWDERAWIYNRLRPCPAPKRLWPRRWLPSEK